jgi:parvulin-like peptidyl-prolyl isomerase
MTLRLPSTCAVFLMGALTMRCATLSPGGRVLAHSSLGDVTAAELERFLDDRGLPSPLLPAEQRRRIEDLLLVRAARAEALRLQPSEVQAYRVARVRREEEVLSGEMRTRLETAARGSAAIPDEEVAAALENRRAAAPSVERLRLRQIFKRMPAHATLEERRAIEGEIREIRGSLLAGADFRLLARERSDSQTAVFDGLVAPLALADLEPALAAALAGLEVGGLSEVLVTSAGLHLFRLEERLPPPPAMPTATLEAAVRLDLEKRAVTAALKRQFDDLLVSSAAEFHPERLDEPEPLADALLFALGDRSISFREIWNQWLALPFLGRRTTSLRSLLEAEVGRQLLVDSAIRQGVASEPGAASRLEQARDLALFDAARQRRLDELAKRVPESTLRRFFEEARGRFQRPERRRLRGILVPLSRPGAANALFDDLDLVARRVRAGDLDFVEQVRRWSRDPSRLEGGDLGWAEERELALWAGPRLPREVFALPVGVVSGPLLVERYDEGRLRDEPAAYLLVRVEEVQPRTEGDFDAQRTEVMAQYLASLAPEVGRSLRPELLAGLNIAILDLRF